MGFLAVKNILPSFYRPSTSFPVVKAFFAESLQAFNWLCSHLNVFTKHLQAFNRLCVSQSVYHHSPQAFNKLHNSKNLYYDPLQAFNRLCGSQNGIAELLQSFNRILQLPKQAYKSFTEFQQQSKLTCRTCTNFHQALW